jgi:hypothetical protein
MKMLAHCRECGELFTVTGKTGFRISDGREQVFICAACKGEALLAAWAKSDQENYPIRRAQQ